MIVWWVNHTFVPNSDQIKSGPGSSGGCFHADMSTIWLKSSQWKLYSLHIKSPQSPLGLLFSLSMGQLIVKLSNRGGIKKQEASLKYQNNGDEGDAACILDSDYQLPDYDVMGAPSRSRPKVNVAFLCGNMTLHPQPQTEERRKFCLCTAIFCTSLNLILIALFASLFLVHTSPFASSSDHLSCADNWTRLAIGCYM